MNRVALISGSVFEQNFSVRDIARSLPSFDGSTSAVDAREVMRKKGWSVAGVRTGGLITGYLELTDLQDGSCADCAHPLTEELLVSDTLPLAPLVIRLKDLPRLFLVYLGEVAGVVERRDLEKEPARMWLFGMVTLLEMRFSRLIEEHFPGDAWKEYLSPARVQKCEELQAERRRRDPQTQLVACLQYADKVQVVARHEPLRVRTQFTSRRQVESIGKRLEFLRNHLAHGQEIVAEGWDTIVELAENLERVVHGPPSAAPDAAGASPVADKSDPQTSLPTVNSSSSS